MGFRINHIHLKAPDPGMAFVISGARKGDTPGGGDSSVRFGLEHFGIDSANVDADVVRLQALGAKLQEGPLTTHSGFRIAFMSGPDDVRFELIQPKA